MDAIRNLEVIDDKSSAGEHQHPGVRRRGVERRLQLRRLVTRIVAVECEFRRRIDRLRGPRRGDDGGHRKARGKPAQQPAAIHDEHAHGRLSPIRGAIAIAAAPIGER